MWSGGCEVGGPTGSPLLGHSQAPGLCLCASPSCPGGWFWHPSRDVPGGRREALRSFGSVRTHVTDTLARVLGDGSTQGPRPWLPPTAAGDAGAVTAPHGVGWGAGEPAAEHAWVMANLSQ